MEPLGLGTLLAFNAALLVAVLGPGPAFVLCVQASLRGGRREGVLTGAGLAVMAGLWTLAALLGLETLFTVVPAAYTVLKIGGALLVLAFAIYTWRTALAPVDATPPISSHRAFLRGFALNLGNPKSILFSAGVLLVIFPPGLSAAAMTAITLNHIALEMVVYGLLATLLSRPAVQARYLAYKPAISRVTALVLGGLGLRLLTTS
ncbi:LysE family translocator [Jannaschia seohaensis]|uniref:Threonine/homoserine/homoserine lactone efflux protein n=1 Tax=Jannaschia seohaensis TaxID=475081 RepID=A0A2Y9AP53_9RHOB|nr:LysE family transporter [Jannaschia seohaensis]PWJ19204.1 threonine/homoserine/homoserine lactone efflux protein [Jannaschia seohaensis]SSA45866.1 Threonine/homoserine/homoserine lactone efflux protein [Jannaschia seohaensis]